MKILGISKNYEADHSATNYTFISKHRLTNEERTIINTLSSHVDITGNRAEITYHGDFADIRPGNEEIFIQYYDIEIRESYDWWDFKIAFDDKSEKIPQKVYNKYFADCGEATMDFVANKNRTVLEICGLRINYIYEDTESISDLLFEIKAEILSGVYDSLKVIKHYCEFREIMKIPKKFSEEAKELSNLLDDEGL